MTRKPIAAGMFYPDNFEELDKQIHKCFTENEKGPGALPIERRDKKIIGVIAPHAGYQFSGAGQAWCYKEIGEAEFADVYVIMGTTHVGFPEAATVIDDFETPLGTVNVDEKFAKSLIEKGVVVEDKMAHQNEHSIEVQLPFLQFVNKENLDKIKIVPIVVGKDANYEKLGRAIASVAKELGRKVMLICSSDFTHYGVHYGYVPFRGMNIKDKLKEFDMAAIKWIKELDSWSFINYVEETGATICGCYAIAAFIEACKSMGAKKVRVEQYYSSGDVTEDWTNAVGYASIVVE
ncbi:AmmeMemoRadiSam system protein B [Candidatus Woesearchaeota archaeon]|nr:AmmeMemoRadiSam system protein B [Candidatus Woesearchaeota archaeon]